MRKNLKRQIRYLERIYSRILSDPDLDRDKTNALIMESFESNDRLKPIGCLSAILTNVTKEQFLTRKQIGLGWKDSVVIISGIIGGIGPILLVIIGGILKVHP